MSREPRIDYKGGLYHVLNRGIAGDAIFRDNADYKKFIEYMNITQDLYPFICFSYVLMPNHFHILIERLNEPLSCIMKSLLSRYAMYYNDKYNRKGHVFQGRYHSILCQKERYLHELIRYIHLNPVRAGLIDVPDKWKWSSFNIYFGERTSLLIDIKMILDYFGNNTAEAKENFYEFTYEGIKEGVKFNLFPYARFPILGDGKFVDKISRSTKEIRRKVKTELRVSLNSLCLIICKGYGVKIADLKSHGGKRKISRVRAIFGYTAHNYCGSGISDIARFINKDPSAVTHAINKIKCSEDRYEYRKVLELVKKFKNSRPSPK